MGDYIIQEYIIGIILGIIGAAINNFGIVLQKRQINIRLDKQIKLNDKQNAKTKAKNHKSYFKDFLWILGILMQSILYLPFIIIALNYIGITLLQPLSASGIIFLVLGLIFLLNEKLKRYEIVGVLLLICGTIFVSLGNIVGDVLLNDLLKTSTLIKLWIYLGIILFLSIVFLLLSFKFKNVSQQFLGLFIGNSYAIVSISMQVFTCSILDILNENAILPLILGSVGAIIFTIFGIAGSQKAFKKGQAINIIPFVQLTVNLFPIIVGVFIFNQLILFPLFF
ncbi:MAG: DMT family transporter [Candidatus Helarchaeota archaeon]